MKTTRIWRIELLTTDIRVMVVVFEEAFMRDSIEVL